MDNEPTFNCTHAYAGEEGVKRIILESILLLITTIIVLISIKMTFKNPKIWDLLNNVMFWVLLLYIVAILVTVIRFPMLKFCVFDDEEDNQRGEKMFTILYNWAVGLIVWISSIMPYNIATMKISGKRKIGGENASGGALKQIAFCVVFFVLLLALSIIIELTSERTTLEIQRTVWRSFTVLNFTVEITLLCLALRKFTGTQLADKFKWYLMSTLWMRGAIAVTLIMKYVEAIETEQLKIPHMFIIASGLLVYNRALLKKITSSVAPSVLTKSTTVDTNSASQQGGSKGSSKTQQSAF